MYQNYRLSDVGLINRDRNYHLNLMEKLTMVMRETL